MTADMKTVVAATLIGSKLIRSKGFVPRHSSKRRWPCRPFKVAGHLQQVETTEGIERGVIAVPKSPSAPAVPG